MVFALFPILWIVLMSLKSNVDVIAYPPKFLFTPILDNFKDLFRAHNFFGYYRNTFIIAIGSIVVTLIFGIPAAYAFARFKFRFRDSLAFTFLSFRFAPELAVILPLFVIFRRLHLYNNFLGLIFVYQLITLPLLIWMLRGYFEEVPVEIEQAARVDGCNWWMVLTRVSIPLVLPGLAATIVLAFIFAWNGLIFGLILGGRDTYPVTMGLLSFMGYQEIKWGNMAAATVMTIVPEFLLASFVLRYLVRGLTFGAVQG
jgi:multiple sugar transport system permease protein